MKCTCHNCGTPGMEVFYEVCDIPVSSCVMFEEAEAAASCPRRDLALGFCQKCTFISNVLFDPSVEEYSNRYEDQQSFSPRFRAYQSGLIARLIARYDLRGKDIVEIGCGKGDFLMELCETGRNRGFGIDPACDPQCIDAPEAAQVRFIADSYSEVYADLPCDFLCCRHTLEHIQRTDYFIGLVRTVLEGRKDVVVFFEVPDVERIVRDRAFWDVYYEHCSYFSAVSLAHVFRDNRFDIIEFLREYDDQYLLIAASLADCPTSTCMAAERDLGQLSREVERFSASIQQVINRWRSRIDGFRRAGKRIAVWGSGSKCVSFLTTVDLVREVAAVVDINPRRQGKFLPGLGIQVEAPESLPRVRPDVILAMNPIYCEEIRQAVERMRVHAQVLAVG